MAPRILSRSTLLLLLPLLLAAACRAQTSTASAYQMSLVMASSSIRSAATATPFPTPMPCTGEACTEHNASLQDLNVIQHQNGTYFRISKDNGTGTGLVLASAPALAGPWVLQQSIFGAQGPPLADFDMSRRGDVNLWTPELHYFNSTYYLFYALFNHGVFPGFQLRVATSPSMADNTWTDFGTIGVPQPRNSSNFWAAIDGNLLTDYATDPYGAVEPYSLVFGSFGAALYRAELQSDNALQVIDPGSPNLVPLIQDQLSPVDVSNIHEGNNRTGGSFHSQINGWVYFFFDRGSCCSKTVESAYIVQVCRAPTAAGPFYDREGRDCAGHANGTLNNSGTTILQSHSPTPEGLYEVLAPGAVGIVSSSEGPIMTYQYRNQTQKQEIPISLNFGFNYLNFDSEGWPFLSETAQQVPNNSTSTPTPSGSSPTPTPTNGAASVVSGSSLGLAWLGLALALAAAVV